MQEQSIRRYFLFGLFVIGIGLAVTIFWPFAKVLIVSIALSAVLYPVYRTIKKYIKVSWISSLLTVILFLIVLCLPLYIIGTMVFNQAQNIYTWLAGHGGLDNITAIFNKSIQNVFPGGAINLRDGIAAVTQNFAINVGNVFTATVSTVFSLFLVLLSMFYFLKDGINWKHLIVHFSPLSDEAGDKILSKLSATISGIVKGYLLIAIIQGILMGVGLAIFNVPNAALWGVLAGISSMIPTIGTALVSVPAVIFLLIIGRTGAAIGLAAWGTLMVGSIDNFLTPYLVGRKIAIHPLLIMFSVLGGVILMGPIGILVGPLTISFLYALSSVYRTELTV